MSLEIITYTGTKKALTQGTEAGIIETCIRVVREATALAPLKDGRLKNSIMWKTSDMDGGFNDSGNEQADAKLEIKPGKMEAYVGSNLDYATYQEFGTKYMSPQPYLRPAIAIVRKTGTVDDILDKIRKETARGPLKEGQKRETF